MMGPVLPNWLTPHPGCDFFSGECWPSGGKFQFSGTWSKKLLLRRGVVRRFNGFDLKVIKVGFFGDDVVISGDMFIECLFFFEDR